jgi:hypothetical protein
LICAPPKAEITFTSSGLASTKSFLPERHFVEEGITTIRLFDGGNSSFLPTRRVLGQLEAFRKWRHTRYNAISQDPVGPGIDVNADLELQLEQIIVSATNLFRRMAKRRH